MTTYSMKLVTVITEALTKVPLCRLLSEVGAHGYTVIPVEGMGSKGIREGDLPEYANIQVEVILQPAAAEVLLGRLEKDFFSCYAMVAYVTDVGVLRLEKF